MRSDILKIYILELIMIFFTLINFFVFKLDYLWLVLIFSVFTIISFMGIGNKRIKSRNANEVKIMMLVFGFVYLILFYLMGIYFGFYRSVVTLSIKTIFYNIIPIIILIFQTEMLRNLFFSRKSKFSYILGTILFVLVDVSLNKSIGLNYDLSTILTFFGYVLLTSISSNLLYNYICKNFGYEGNILFRVVTTCYMYIIPFIPNVYMFIRIFLKVLSHFVIYLIINNLYYKVEHKYERTNVFEQILTVVSVGFIGIFCVLVSCKFKYGMLVIGSESMSGVINKGDVIVFEQYDKQVLSSGNIIVFQHDNMLVIHRIIGISEDNDEVRIYTKGDANVQADDGYILLKDVIGVERFSVPYMGIPSLLVKELVG